MQRLKVTDAMQLQHIASPATPHRKLSRLIAHGYVQLAFGGKNRLTKFIRPTAKATQYFEALGS